jgi:hypothetical protein
MFDVKHFVLSHLIWVVALLVAIFGVHSYLQEHDARIVAESQAKAIEAANATLQSQIASSDALAARTIAALKAQRAQVTTPAQAIAAIPDVSTLPLNSRVAVDNPVQVSVDATALYNELNQAKQDAVSLNACVTARTADEEIIKNDKQEIVGLKKKPAFWHRVGSTLKIVGIGIGIGVILGAHV